MTGILSCCLAVLRSYQHFLLSEASCDLRAGTVLFLTVVAVPSSKGKGSIKVLNKGTKDGQKDIRLQLAPTRMRWLRIREY